MSIREDVRALLSYHRGLRACLFGVIVVGLSLLAAWPQGTLDTAVRTGQTSDTFAVVSVCFLLVLLYLGARFGADDFSADSGTQIHEYATLTPISLPRLAAARALAGAAHTGFLVLLGTPLLVASLSVGGASASELLACVVVLGAAGLAARMWGLLGLSVAGAHRALRGIVAFTGIAAVMIVTFFLAPSVSPFQVLATLPQGTDLAGAWRCAAASAGASVVLAVGSAAALAARRARARRRSGKGA